MRRLALILATALTLVLPGVAQGRHHHRPWPCAVAVTRRHQVTPCHTCPRFGWCLGPARKA